MIYVPGCGICAELHPYKACPGKDGENTACLLLAHLANALGCLVSCVQRDRGGSGILLPTEAALATAKELLASYYSGSDAAANPIKEE